jgi:hypothetical protein
LPAFPDRPDFAPSGIGARTSDVAFFWRGNRGDSFNAAFRIPNLLRDFFAEGALSVAYVRYFPKN